MIDTTDKFIVRANRTAGSALGAASAPCKDENGRVLYLDEKDANEYCKRLNDGCRSGNVFYTVELA